MLIYVKLLELALAKNWFIIVFFLWTFISPSRAESTVINHSSQYDSLLLELLHEYECVALLRIREVDSPGNNTQLMENNSMDYVSQFPLEESCIRQRKKHY